MARLNIDTGTLGNPATGDTVRTAMTKINTNFEELYLSLLQSDDQGGFITTNVTNGDIRVQPNGAGIIEIDKLKITDDDITSLVTNGNVAITGNGTGGVTIEGITFKGTELTSDDSTQVTIKENLNVTGVITGDGSGLTNIGAGSVTVDPITFVGDDSTGTAVNTGETFKFAGTQNITTAVSGDTLTITGPDLSSYVTASSSATFTNKTFDANGTGNSISNIEVADFAAAAIVTEGEGIGSNDNDTTIPTSAAVKDYVDARDIGDLSVIGSTISAPSNADLTLTTSGTGNVVASGSTVTADEFIGEMNGAMVFDARNTSGGTISKGEAVYIAGLSGNTPTIAKARANSASTMPAFGIAVADISDNTTGQVATFGSLKGLDVSDFGETSITFALGNTIYVSSAEAGKLTNVAPTGESNLIQNIGKIERATPTTNMTIKVGGAGRTNATPALDNGNIFIGNGSNQSSTVSLATQIKSYTGLTVVGDDSSGTGFNIGETIKVAGATGVTTAVSGDTLTITGPSLTSYITASSSDTLTNKTIDANGTGNSISNLEVADFAGSAIINVAETLASNDSDTALVTAGAIIDYVDAQDGNIASDTLTFTNKTFDVEGTGNSISNIDVADFKAAAIVTEAEGIGSNDNDTTLPTSAAVKDYVDNNAGDSTGDLTITGSTISGASNGDITITSGGTGSVSIEGLAINGNQLSSTDSSQINVQDGLEVDGNVNASSFISETIGPKTVTYGSGITSSGSFDIESAAGNSVHIEGVSINDNNISSRSSNADLELSASGTGAVKVTQKLVLDTSDNDGSTVTIDATKPVAILQGNTGAGDNEYTLADGTVAGQTIMLVRGNNPDGNSRESIHVIFSKFNDDGTIATNANKEIFSQFQSVVTCIWNGSAWCTDKHQN